MMKKSSTKKKSKEAKQKEELENKLAAAEESAKEWQDKYMRLSAEFDNYRKTQGAGMGKGDV